MSHEHRKKAMKGRNGRTRYEKGRALHSNAPTQNALVRGYRGSTTHAPEVPHTTLAEVWPD